MRSVVMSRAAARFTSVVIALIDLNATSGVAVASSTKVDFGDISHKGLKNLGQASTGLKLSLAQRANVERTF